MFTITVCWLAAVHGLIRRRYLERVACVIPVFFSLPTFVLRCVMLFRCQRSPSPKWPSKRYHHFSCFLVLLSPVSFAETTMKIYIFSFFILFFSFCIIVCILRRKYPIEIFFVVLGRSDFFFFLALRCQPSSSLRREDRSRRHGRLLRGEARRCGVRGIPLFGGSDQVQRIHQGEKEEETLECRRLG